jgi:hypothetical protein
VTTPGPYDVDSASRDIHAIVIGLAESLDEDQLRWRPDDFATSIGFHLWHLGRESDYLRSALVARFEELGLEVGPDWGPTTELWTRKDLAARWGFPAEVATAVGTGLTDEIASTLPIPAKADVLAYLRGSYAELEAFVERLDRRFPAGTDIPDPDLARRLGTVRINVLNFLTHDCRHLGMMEVLKGLQTGFGSATETRS